MSKTRAFPVERLPVVAEDIAEFFGDEGLIKTGETLLVGPPIEVYSAGLVPDETPPPSLEDIASWTERFHHQVLDTTREARGYALTRWSADDIVVCKISASAEFASAVERGLVSLRDRMPQEAIVRLVSVPEMQLDTLWSLDPTKPKNSTMMVVRQPEEAELELFQELTEDEFIEVLMTHVHMAGMVLPMVDSLYDRPLMDILCASKDEVIDDVSDETATTLFLQERMEHVRHLSA